MKISRRSEYGLAAMVELAYFYQQNPVPARDVAEKQRIPLQYLEQIFNRLKKAGLIKTARGPRGGYLLSQHPSKIRIKDILDVLEEKGLVVDCLNGKKKHGCNRSDFCNVRKFFQELADQMKKILNSTTLQDLCNKQPKRRRGNNIEHTYTFQI